MATTQPVVLLKRTWLQQPNHNIRAESPHIQVPSRQSPELGYCVGGDHRDARIVEDAMLHLHHLNRRPVAASNLSSQLLPKDSHVLAIGRSNMRRQVAWITLFATVGCE